MTDTPGTLEERLRAPLPEGMCGQSMGCNAASICLCSHIEDQRELLTEAADENASLRARVEVLREALVDLMSWFPEKPSDPEWRIKGGEFGADEAVEHARSLVEKEPTT